MVDYRHKKSKYVENKKLTTTGIFLRKNSYFQVGNFCTDMFWN